MEKVIEILQNINDAILVNFWNKVFPFLDKEWVIIYTSILLILAIFLLVGIFCCFRRFPKFFLFLVILVAIICLGSYFIIYKDCGNIILI